LISFSFLLALFRLPDSRSTFPSRLRRPRLQRVIGILILCATSGTNLIFPFLRSAQTFQYSRLQFISFLFFLFLSPPFLMDDFYTKKCE
jgi:hypothetical protein